MRCSRLTRPPDQPGTATTTTATASGDDGRAFHEATGWAACGRCSPANAATTSLPPATAPKRTFAAMEGLARKTGLLPEQSWDEADRPEILHVAGQTYRLRDAADVGSCRIHQAASLHGGRQGLRCHPRGCRTYLGKRTTERQLEVWKPRGMSASCAPAKLSACRAMLPLPSIGRATTGRPRTIPRRCKMRFKLIMST